MNAFEIWFKRYATDGKKSVLKEELRKAWTSAIRYQAIMDAQPWQWHANPNLEQTEIANHNKMIEERKESVFDHLEY